jgi:hypothetical protein
MANVGGAFDSRGYGYDGRVTSKTWAQPLSGATAYAMTFGAGETDSSSNGALDTVLKSVSVNGAVYNYFYDAFNRRRLKAYPTWQAEWPCAYSAAASAWQTRGELRGDKPTANLGSNDGL